MTNGELDGLTIRSPCESGWTAARVGVPPVGSGIAVGPGAARSKPWIASAAAEPPATNVAVSTIRRGRPPRFMARRAVPPLPEGRRKWSTNELKGKWGYKNHLAKLSSLH